MQTANLDPALVENVARNMECESAVVYAMRRLEISYRTACVCGASGGLGADDHITVARVRIAAAALRGWSVSTTIPV